MVECSHCDTAQDGVFSMLMCLEWFQVSVLADVGRILIDEVSMCGQDTVCDELLGESNSCHGNVGEVSKKNLIRGNCCC